MLAKAVAAPDGAGVYITGPAGAIWLSFARHGATRGWEMYRLACTGDSRPRSEPGPMARMDEGGSEEGILRTNAMTGIQ